MAFKESSEERMVATPDLGLTPPDPRGYHFLRAWQEEPAHIAKDHSGVDAPWNKLGPVGDRTWEGPGPLTAHPSSFYETQAYVIYLIV